MGCGEEWMKNHIGCCGRANRMEILGSHKTRMNIHEWGIAVAAEEHVFVHFTYD